MFKNKRLLLVTLVLVIAAVVVMGMKVGFPWHRTIAFVLLGLGWIPLIASYRINRRLLRIQKSKLKKKTRPYLPHIVVAVLLLAAFYITATLFPVEKSPLVQLSNEDLRADIGNDLSAYRMLRESADAIIERFDRSRLLEKDVSMLRGEQRAEIRSLWRDGVMTFLEFDLLKEKYRGFYQVDYIAEPALHSDAFMLAYMSYVVQYSACLRIVELIGENEFMETLLNEEGGGIPADSCFFMKQRLTHPNVMLRMNAAAAYYELVKKDVTLDEEVVADFEERRADFNKRLGLNADIFVKNPLAVFERAAFETILPLQENVALQMSNIRTAKRDYLITPEILAEHQPKLRPGDILIQRRNWHMTNIGIPGFWPHVALYVGTPQEALEYFDNVGVPALEHIKTMYPDEYATWNGTDEEGRPLRVIEAIRPGVVFQSLENSAKCDYLAVIRPNLSQLEKFRAVMRAFSHKGKPYDLNFDFTTDNELVCSELVYKAYHSNGKLRLKPQVINGRLLLTPNGLARQAVQGMDNDPPSFEFVLFLDAVEETDTIVERDEAEFKASWERPKWDIMQD